MFDELASWYIPSLMTPDNSISNSEDEVSMVERPPDEEEIGALEKSSISFHLSRTNEKLNRNEQLDEEPTSSGDSVVLSPRQKPKRWPMCKEKGKIKMSEYGVNTGFGPALF